MIGSKNQDYMAVAAGNLYTILLLFPRRLDR